MSCTGGTGAASIGAAKVSAPASAQNAQTEHEYHVHCLSPRTDLDKGISNFRGLVSGWRERHARIEQVQRMLTSDVHSRGFCGAY